MSKSQSQSFSGKICVYCSKPNFILDNDKISYTSSGASIQTDTYSLFPLRVENKTQMGYAAFSYRKSSGSYSSKHLPEICD
jgi:hypothetical protein